MEVLKLKTNTVYVLEETFVPLRTCMSMQLASYSQEAFLLAHQQDSTTMAVTMIATKVQDFRKGGPINHRWNDSPIHYLNGPRSTRNQLHTRHLGCSSWTILPRT